MTVKCWYCDHFAVDTGKTGRCRRHSPRAIDYQTIGGTQGGSVDNVFPLISDASIEWCGDYKPPREDRGDPPA